MEKKTEKYKQGGHCTRVLELQEGRMNFAVVIELLCFLVDVNLDRGKGELGDNC